MIPTNGRAISPKPWVGTYVVVAHGFCVSIHEQSVLIKLDFFEDNDDSHGGTDLVVLI